jgi:hypothetical protein
MISRHFNARPDTLFEERGGLIWRAVHVEPIPPLHLVGNDPPGQRLRILDRYHRLDIEAEES